MMLAEDAIHPGVAAGALIFSGQLGRSHLLDIEEREERGKKNVSTGESSHS